jgi:exosortase A-associated hydrolase 1
VRVGGGMTVEEPLSIDAGDHRLIGVFHRPANTDAQRAVVVLVGGPQYRVGSHRQFVLLARDLCQQGLPVLRFDFSGMGDSGGARRGFDDADDDIRVAIDRVQMLQPSVREVCLWGLCDAASAALIYAARDPRVTRLVLLNPWVRTSEGQAQAYLERYYGRRITSGAFWRKLLANPTMLLRAGADLVANVRTASRGCRAETGGAGTSYLARMLAGAQRYSGRILLLLSGADLVATEFELLLERSSAWRDAFAPTRTLTLQLRDANHTFARRAWRDWVAQHSAQFVVSE